MFYYVHQYDTAITSSTASYKGQILIRLVSCSTVGW